MKPWLALRLRSADEGPSLSRGASSSTRQLGRYDRAVVRAAPLAGFLRCKAFEMEVAACTNYATRA